MSSEEDYFTQESSQDSFEAFKELESKLYSAVHYNNLSEYNVADLPDGVKIDGNERNKLVISLDANEIDDNCMPDAVDSKINKCRSTDVRFSNIPDTSGCLNINKDVNTEVSSKNVTNTKSNCSLISGVSTEIHKEVQKVEEEVICVFENNASQKETIPKAVETSVDNDVASENNSSFNDSFIDLSESGDDVNHAITLNISEDVNSQVDEIVISDDEVSTKPVKRRKRKISELKYSRLKTLCPKKWTSSMVKFYCKISQSKLNFNSTELIMKMRKSFGKSMWNVSVREFDVERRKRMRCISCKQIGHFAKNCSEPIKPLTCYMCGEINHVARSCPQRMCLRCGSKTSNYIKQCMNCVKDLKTNMCCYLCGGNHRPKLCPDIWRGFHMTTDAGSIVMPSTSDLNLKRICSNCGINGHWEFECRKRSNLNYVRLPICDLTVKNYIGIANLYSFERQNLSVIIKLDNEGVGVLSSDDGLKYLQNLSNMSMAQLELDANETASCVTVKGSENQCRLAIDDVCKYLHKNIQQKDPSFHKHKTRKKRRTV